MAAARSLARVVSRALPALVRSAQIRQPSASCSRPFSQSRRRDESASSWAKELDILPQTTQEPLPLPDLPEVAPYPTPILTQEDIDTYVLPLYDHGWEIVNKNDRPALSRGIRFKTYTYLMEFVNEISQYVKAESHHPWISFGDKNLTIETTTHTAKHADGQPTQGPTLRDVRLALLVEQAYERFRAAQRVFGEPDAASFRWKQPRLLTSILTMKPDPPPPKQTVPKKLSHRCPICRSNLHLGRDCPKRYTERALRPCAHCGGEHFSINCTKKGDPNVKPSTPCKTCGEWHWSKSCPHKRIVRDVSSAMQGS